MTLLVWVLWVLPSRLSRSWIFSIRFCIFSDAIVWTLSGIQINIKQYQYWNLKILILKRVDPYWQTSEAWARPIHGKLIQQSILEFRGMTQACFFLENSSKTEHLVEKYYLTNSGTWNRPISFKYGWVFQKSVCVTPRKTEISGKFLDEFSKICQ